MIRLINLLPSRPEPFPLDLRTNLAGDEPDAYNELKIDDALNLLGELIDDNPCKPLDEIKKENGLKQLQFNFLFFMH